MQQVWVGGLKLLFNLVQLRLMLTLSSMDPDGSIIENLYGNWASNWDLLLELAELTSDGRRI